MTFQESHEGKSNTPFGHAMTRGAEQVTVQLHGKPTAAPEQVGPTAAGKTVGDEAETPPEAISKFDRPSAEGPPDADNPENPSGISAA